MAGPAGIVNLEHSKILDRNSARVIRWSGFLVKILPRMSFRSSVKGRMDFRKSGSLVYAL
jgi:hypothetical protein